MLWTVMADTAAAAVDLILARRAWAVVVHNNDDDKDKAIHIVLPINDTDVEFENIAVVLVPPPPLPSASAFVPFLGGECPLLTPNMLSTFELATVPPQKMACRLKWPRCCPCCRNQPWAPNHLDKSIPSHPQPMMGGTSTSATVPPQKTACQLKRPRRHPCS